MKCRKKENLCTPEMRKEEKITLIKEEKFNLNIQQNCRVFDEKKTKFLC
jgi:hypothetical protein